MDLQEAYYRHGNHLALYRRIQDMKSYWDAQWITGNIRESLEAGKTGELGEFEKPFIQHLPRGGIILEAGCGTGRYVSALRARGFAVEGIDYASETIQAIHDLDPTLKIRQGDIFAIDRPDGYYGGYVSIGVLEHNFSGPQAGLREAHRVLRPGGIAVITVPHLNAYRLGLWESAQEATQPVMPSGLKFYQDHIESKDFMHCLATSGFKVIQLYPYELYGGLSRQSTFWRRLSEKQFYSWRFRQVVRAICRRAPTFLKERYGHMMAYVCEKAV